MPAWTRRRPSPGQRRYTESSAELPGPQVSASAHGSVPDGPPVQTRRAIPRSRAYWELKAEQMLNRIFDPVELIDLAVEQPPEPPSHPGPITAARQGPDAPRPPVAGAAAAAIPDPDSPFPLPDAAASEAGRMASAGSPAEMEGAPPPAATRAAQLAALRWHRPGSRPAPAAGRPDERRLLIGALCGVCLASLVGSLLYFGYWTRLQQTIAQERNLLLLERLRSLGPANPSPVPAPEPAAPILPGPSAQSAAGGEGLPPPPPQEAWVKELSSLPPAAPSPPRVLTVPVSPRLAPASAPSARTPGTPSAGVPAAAATRAAGPLPQLVGVVAGAGRTPSAIFLVGGSSMSVASGEQIGSTGWRLRSAEGETALIERAGELRQVSIASGNGF